PSSKPSAAARAHSASRSPSTDTSVTRTTLLRSGPVARTWQSMFRTGDGDDVPEAEPEEAGRGLFSRLRENLSRSRRAMAQQLAGVMFNPADSEVWERLEEALLLSDCGVPATVTVIERLEAEADAGRLTTADEQLETWAQRAEADFVSSQSGGDPAAVAFDAVAAAEARGRDVVIVDTAGRLHTQGHLMDELRKIHRVIAGRIPGAPHEVLLTIDATTGQNGLQQARLFAEAVDVTGIVLTKLDGTAKGGIALAIAHELGIPVKLIGIGEGIEDLRPFDPDSFAQALFANGH